MPRYTFDVELVNANGVVASSFGDVKVARGEFDKVFQHAMRTAIGEILRGEAFFNHAKPEDCGGPWTVTSVIIRIIPEVG